MVDVTPAREHLVWLRSQGMGVQTIAKASGINPATLGGIMWGRSGQSKARRVNRYMARRILAIRPDLDLLAPEANVDGTGTRRRLQALGRMGWTWTALAKHTEVTDVAMQRLGQARSSKVQAHTARMVRDLYDQLWNVPPTPDPSPMGPGMIKRAKRRAIKAGWVGPLDWDDIDTDPEPPKVDEVEGPLVDLVAIERALHGDRVKLTSPERREAVRIAHGRAWSDQVTAERLHVSDQTVFRIREELGLKAWGMAEMRTLRHVHSEGVAA